MNGARDRKKASAGLLIALVFCLGWAGQDCPHEGPDHRLLGRAGCWIQRMLTIESARPPSKIWFLDFGKTSMRIDPRHPHLLVEWPTASGKLWRVPTWLQWGGKPKTCMFLGAWVEKGGGAHKGKTRETAVGRPEAGLD